MGFATPAFLCVLLPAACAGCFLLRRWTRASNLFLAVISLIFYAAGEPLGSALLLGSAAVDYALGWALHKSKRRIWLVVGVAAHLALLGVFKYAGFVLRTLGGLLGRELPVPNWTLPIGISFFTFQAMSYVLDVYRGEANVARNYFDVLLYISLFPQLIAGPIVRYSDIDAQIHCRVITLNGVAAGFRRFCFGLGKKVLLANTLAMTADAVYALPEASLNAPIAWLGALSYLLQIYFDFSGYSDMAIGLGEAFGFTFRENFLYPYTALSMQDFWRRWHISLSTWFREYVYIPLGGNRKGKLRTGVNKLTVFLLTGLWHGASWNFALWGLYHGGFLMLESYGALKPDKWPKILRRVYVVLAVTVGFVLFRAETLPAAWLMIGRMFAGWSFTPALGATLSQLVTPLCAIALLAGAFACTPYAHSLGEWLSAQRPGWAYGVYGTALGLLLLCALCLSTASYNPFIYFRF